MKVIFNESMYEELLLMGKLQERDQKEQFATGYGRIMTDENNNEVLCLDTFERWPEYILGPRTAGSIEEIPPESWSWLLENMKTKKADFVITIHTHPSGYGTNRPLNGTDKKTFIAWTDYFANQFEIPSIININGIFSQNGGLKLYRYDLQTKIFESVDGYVSKATYNEVPKKRHR